MITGTTKSGFSFEIDERILTDYRYVRKSTKLMKEIASDEESELAVIDGMFELIEMVLGEDQANALADHIADQHDGYADITIVQKEFFEITASVKELKN